MQIRYPIKTNFEDLDRFIGGLYPGEIMVFGSYPRVDRLSFLATLIKKITLESGCKSLYFYNDLTKYGLRERLVSSISGISINKIHTAGRDIINLTGLTKEEARIFEKLIAEVCDLPIVIVEARKIRSFDFSLFLNETIQILKNNFGDLGEINLPFSTETYSYEEYPASIKSSLIL